ncbi:hypothetical protein HanPI659440_Chr15g0585201 [Helianthus annuus]|nr:hypothetical protein HanPI659440_Chr15g0585201 [Helianthus annuus]
MKILFSLIFSNSDLFIIISEFPSISPSTWQILTTLFSEKLICDILLYKGLLFINADFSFRPINTLLNDTCYTPVFMTTPLSSILCDLIVLTILRILRLCPKQPVFVIKISKKISFTNFFLDTRLVTTIKKCIILYFFAHARI